MSTAVDHRTFNEALADVDRVPDIVEDIGRRLVKVAGLMRAAGDTNGLCPLCGSMTHSRRFLLNHLIDAHDVRSGYLGTGMDLLERWQAAADSSGER